MTQHPLGKILVGVAISKRGQGDGSAVSFFQTIRKGLQKQKGGDIMGTKERESNAMSLL